MFSSTQKQKQPYTKLTQLIVVIFYDNKGASGSPAILAINKIDCAPSKCFEFINTIGESFNKHISKCAIIGQGICDLEATILELVGFNNIPAGRHTWAVNQLWKQYMLNSIYTFRIVGLLLTCFPFS